MSVFEFLFIRSGLGFLIILIKVNTDFKKAAWDSIGDNRFNLFVKVSQNSFSLFIGFSVLKYFPMTYIRAL